MQVLNIYMVIIRHLQLSKIMDQLLLGEIKKTGVTAKLYKTN